MVTNIIMLKLKEKSDENIAALQKVLLDMRGNIEQLYEIEVKANIRSGPAAYDIVIMAKYESMEKFNEYINHPYHIGVGKYVQDVCEQSASVCYEE